MKHGLPILIWAFLSLGSFDASGQISIDFPSVRAIFQRDKNKNATIYISGKYTKSVDRIEAKLIAINGGADVGWATIHSNPQGGLYNGGLTTSGGWYELQVRGMKGDQQVSFNSVSPVGIGEVFLIAGQSNGQGFQNTSTFDYGAQRASDDRVNCIRYSNNGSSDTNFPYPSFSHLESDYQIAPRGQSAWSWGN